MQNPSNPDKSLLYTLILNFLKSENIEEDVLSRLSESISCRQGFSKHLSLSQRSEPSTYAEIVSQIGRDDSDILLKIINNYSRVYNNMALTRSFKDEWVGRISEKYSTMNSLSGWRCPRRKQLLSLRKKQKVQDSYPSELFVSNFTKLKTCFGHKNLDSNELFQENEEIQTTPVYNLIYDKSGKVLISGDDEGVIKIWSAETGMLLTTLKGHKSLINSMEISPCNKYLGSCSNDGTVRIWNLIDKKPVSVFLHVYQERMLNVTFFQANEQTNITPSLFNTTELFLATASEEGNIYIYRQRDWINNDGKLNPEQRFLHIDTGIIDCENITLVRGVYSLEFHPDGYITAGMNSGHIIIWDSVLRYPDITTQHNLPKVVWVAHKKSCHSVLWNKLGTRLISGSFDGTARIWRWRKEGLKINEKPQSEVLSFEAGRALGDDKCVGIEWSHSGRFAFATFSRKSKRKNSSQKLLSNIQVYDTILKKVIQKFETDKVSVEMNESIYALSGHPFKESILFTADYEGRILIWDIETGAVLNTFLENGGHFFRPDLRLPILELKVSPDGYNFAVSNYYGSFSIYGYGDKDIYNYCPTEQFFEKDQSRFDVDGMFRAIDINEEIETHLVRDGHLCNFNQLWFQSQLKNDYASLVKSGIYSASAWEGSPETESDLSVDPLKSMKNMLFFLKKNEKDEEVLRHAKKEQEQDRQNSQALEKISLKEKFNQEKQKIAALACPQFYEHLTNIGILDSLSAAERIKIETDIKEFTAINSIQSSFRAYGLYNQNGNISSFNEQKHPNIEKLIPSYQAIEDDEPKETTVQRQISSNVQRDGGAAGGSGEVEMERKKKLKRLVRANNTRNMDENSNEGQILEENNESDENYIEMNVKARRRARTKKDYKEEEEVEERYDKKDDENWEADSDSEERLEDDEEELYSELEHGKKRTRRTNPNVFEDEDEYGSNDRDANGLTRASGNINLRRLKKRVQFDSRVREDYDEEESENEWDKEARNKNMRRNGRNTRSQSNTNMRKDEIQYSKESYEREEERGGRLLRKRGQRTNLESEFGQNRPVKKLKVDDDEFSDEFGEEYDQKKCLRCGLENAKRKCSAQQCITLFHEFCSKKRGLLKEDRFLCLYCLMWKLQNQPAIDYLYRFLDRSWLSLDDQNEYHYVPQLGDEVYYFFQGHEEFLCKYFEIISFEGNNEDVLPFVTNINLFEPTLCKIVKLDYDFPVIRNSRVVKKTDKFPLFMSLKLQIVSNPEETILLRFCNTNSQSFLVLKDIYDYFMKNVRRKVEENSIATIIQELVAQQIQILEISTLEESFPESTWMMAKVRSLEEDGYSLRRAAKKSGAGMEEEVPKKGITTVERVNIWQIANFNNSRSQIELDTIRQNAFNIEEREKLLKLINRLCEEEETICHEFINPINMKDYPSYLDFVKFEMNITKICTRINRGFYRRKEAVLNDIEQIRVNAESFNEANSIIVQDAQAVEKKFKEIIEHFNDPNFEKNFFRQRRENLRPSRSSKPSLLMGDEMMMDLPQQKKEIPAAKQVIRKHPVVEEDFDENFEDFDELDFKSFDENKKMQPQIRKTGGRQLRKREKVNYTEELNQQAKRSANTKQERVAEDYSSEDLDLKVNYQSRREGSKPKPNTRSSLRFN